MDNSTIAAISTATAPAGIGVIRLSGARAAEIADAVFTSASGRKIADISGYQALFGHAYDDGGLIDEVVALRFRAPKSYTGEDVVELSCHGGIYILRRILRALCGRGARLAECGEFTRRAFENGKMDLTAAESVMDLIGADGEQAHCAALSLREGSLYNKIRRLSDALTRSASDIAAWVDFPDEDVPAVENGELKNQLNSVKNSLDALISTADAGKMIKYGVDTVIVGKPNVGKSTVMNLLSRTSRSIVTDIAGTTRDIIEDTVTVGKTVLRLSDTAGIHSTDDTIERIGVDMATRKLDTAALVIAVFDAAKPLDADDEQILSMLSGKRVAAVLNKRDLGVHADWEKVKNTFEHVEISAKQGEYDALAELIERVCGLNALDMSQGILANERQYDCAVRARAAVVDALSALDGGFTLDAVGVCIDDAISALCEMTGEVASEKIIGDVFSRFCVGK